MTFRVLRAVATVPLTFAVCFGVLVAAVVESPLDVWLSLGLAVACLFAICALWELD